MLGLVVGFIPERFDRPRHDLLLLLRNRVEGFSTSAVLYRLLRPLSDQATATAA